jgi:ADP-ribose pyrophosphatase YjhB (NUDIX family)
MRPVCTACGWIYFTDPKVAVAAVLLQDGQILLGRRAVDPQRGRWTVPAGFLDAGEDPRRAAEREVLEETGLQVRAAELLDVIAGQEHPRGAHLIIFYRAELLGGELQAADDIDAARFFPLDALPELAFTATEQIVAKLRCP